MDASPRLMAPTQKEEPRRDKGLPHLKPVTRVIFILHEWLHRRGQAVAYGKVEIELDAFFAMHGAAQDKLHQLIDTLVEE
jgi:hypothetical protein